MLFFKPSKIRKEKLDRVLRKIYSKYATAVRSYNAKQKIFSVRFWWCASEKAYIGSDRSPSSESQILLFIKEIYPDFINQMKNWRSTHLCNRHCSTHFKGIGLSLEFCYCYVSYCCHWARIFQRVRLRYTTTGNHSQPRTTIHYHPPPAKIYPQPPAIPKYTHHHPAPPNNPYDIVLTISFSSKYDSPSRDGDFGW